MDQAYLKLCFEYNPDTGEMRWRSIRPLSHFADIRSRKIWHSRFAGKLAGVDNGHGYLRVTVGEKSVLVHRIAWILTHGDIPAGRYIDHANGTRTDNRITNLRLATRSENLRNSTSLSRNTSVVRGVCLHKATGKYQAQINVDGRYIYLGYFDTIEEATQVRRAASLKYHGEFSPENRS